MRATIFSVLLACIALPALAANASGVADKLSSPNSRPGDIVWGVGPAFLQPTVFDAAIGTQNGERARRQSFCSEMSGT